MQQHPQSAAAPLPAPHRARRSRTGRLAGAAAALAAVIGLSTLTSPGAHT